MGNQQSDNQGVWWGWWVLVIIIGVYFVCASTPNRNRTKPVPIHTTEAAIIPERFRNPTEFPTEFPTEEPGGYPDALDPLFRKAQSQKLAAWYAQCHSIDPLYFYYNP